MMRYQQQDDKLQFQHDRIEARKEKYQAGKKNEGGAAFNILNMDYDNTKNGHELKRIDNDAVVRATMRSKVLDQKNNCGFNIISGEDRKKIQVPHHERYNPITNAARDVLGSSHS